MRYMPRQSPAVPLQRLNEAERLALHMHASVLHMEVFLKSYWNAWLMPKDFRSMLHRHETLDQLCDDSTRNFIELRSACVIPTRLRTDMGWRG